MREILEEYTVSALVVIAEANEIEVPLYNNGKSKMSKSDLIELLLENKVEVKEKVEESGEAVTFHRQKPISKSIKFKRRRY